MLVTVSDRVITVSLEGVSAGGAFIHGGKGKA